MTTTRRAAGVTVLVAVAVGGRRPRLHGVGRGPAPGAGSAGRAAASSGCPARRCCGSPPTPRSATRRSGPCATSVPGGCGSTCSGTRSRPARAATPGRSSTASWTVPGRRGRRCSRSCSGRRRGPDPRARRARTRRWAPDRSAPTPPSCAPWRSATPGRARCASTPWRCGTSRTGRRSGAARSWRRATSTCSAGPTPRSKAVNRATTVVTGGLAPAFDTSTSVSPRTFLKRIYAAGARPYFDAVAMHPYSYPTFPSQTGPYGWGNLTKPYKGTPSLRATMDTNGDAAKKILGHRVRLAGRDRRRGRPGRAGHRRRAGVDVVPVGRAVLLLLAAPGQHHGARRLDEPRAHRRHPPAGAQKWPRP